MQTTGEVAVGAGGDRPGRVTKLLWGAGLLAAYAAGVAALHLALTWFHEPMVLVAS